MWRSLGLCCVLAEGCGGSAPFHVGAAVPDDSCLGETNEGEQTVADLPPSERAKLEARLRDGTVVVAYWDCALQVLEGCRQRGSYVSEPDTAEVRLEGYEAGDFLDAAECVGATHVVGRLSRDPFEAHLVPLPPWLSDRGPPGTVKVSFRSGEPDRDWDVVSGEGELCATPCALWIDLGTPHAFRLRPPTPVSEDESPGEDRDDPVSPQAFHYVEVPDLGGYPEGSRLEVRAHAARTGRLVGGVALTLVGGLGVLAGAALAATQCGRAGDACVGGLVALPVGALLTGGGIWLLVGSGAYAEVRREEPSGFGGYVPEW